MYLHKIFHKSIVIKLFKLINFVRIEVSNYKLTSPSIYRVGVCWFHQFFRPTVSYIVVVYVFLVY